MNELTATTRLRPRRDVVAVKRGDQTALLDVGGSHFYTLNGIAGEIWTFVGDGLTVAAIVSRLAEKWDASSEVLTADTMALLRQMTDARLLTVV